MSIRVLGLKDNSQWEHIYDLFHRAAVHHQMVIVRRIGVFQNALSWVILRQACTLINSSYVDDCVDTEYLFVIAFVLTVCPEDCAPNFPGPVEC